VVSLAAPDAVDEVAELLPEMLAERDRGRRRRGVVRDRLVERRVVARRGGVLGGEPERPQVLVRRPEDQIRRPLRAVERVGQVAIRLRPRTRVPQHGERGVGIDVDERQRVLQRVARGAVEADLVRVRRRLIERAVAQDAVRREGRRAGAPRATGSLAARRTLGGRRRQPVIGQRTARTGDDRARLRSRRRVGAAEAEPELLPLARSETQRRRDLEDGMRAAVEPVRRVAGRAREPLQDERRRRPDRELRRRAVEALDGGEAVRGRLHVVRHRAVATRRANGCRLERVQEARAEPPLLDVRERPPAAPPREPELHAHEHPRHVAFRAEDGADEREPLARVLDLEPRRAERAPRRTLAGALIEIAAPRRAAVIPVFVQNRNAGPLRLRRDEPAETVALVEQGDGTVVRPLEADHAVPTMSQLRRRRQGSGSLGGGLGVLIVVDEAGSPSRTIHRP
jgi:hypothetical protein